MGAERELLIFEVDKRVFALPLEVVREVHHAVAITPLPQAMRAVEGIINVRGTIVPVYDLRSRFQLAARAVRPADYMIVAEISDGRVALRADHVSDLVVVDEALIDRGRQIPHVAGVAKLDDGLIMIQDLPAFLSLAERSELRALVAREASR
jgi:purine-binding chemotaxis protein CheW